MKSFYLFLLLITFQLSAQTTINGKVLDANKQPIFGANVYLDGTYDGNTTNQKGEFSFTTQSTGTQMLVVSFISFETQMLASNVATLNNITITMREDVNTLDAVVISAGTFEAGDNSKVSVLKPLDVVTTASALGDFVGALQTLPGTSTVAEDGRLFVRGGEANETQIFIDGIRVFSPFSPTTNNIPTRGRYSPFLFDGITFSTGGYSAEYGQALSSVLLLNTIDEPDQEKTDLGIMSVGANIGNTQIWNNNSLSVNATYINLAPYVGLFPDRNTWHKPYESVAGETVFRHKTENGLIKLYGAFDVTNFKLTQDHINYDNGIEFKLKNKNGYFNGSYYGLLNDSWTIFGGLSYALSNTKTGIETSKIKNVEHSAHAKLKLKKRFNSRVRLQFGAEYFATNFNENYSDNFTPQIDYGYNNNLVAAFAETDVFFSKKLALKAGLRASHSMLFNNNYVSPRVSLAYKTGGKSQMSLAYGNFYQQPNSTVLKFNKNLQPQEAKHYILNYQYNNNGKIFRAETYYKDYTSLVKYNNEFPEFNSEFNNSGFGYAKGLDLFWRDSKSIKNIDYWVSYSFLDTERDFKNYPKAAQPSFVNMHNISLVGKYWVENWRSQVGFSYNFASGRTYTDPNKTGFLNQQTKSFNSLSLNWAYLLSPQKIIYASVNNVLGFKNINGYQYSDERDVNNNFSRRALQPATDQFFFVGFFWTISEKGTDNQLDNL